MLCQLSEVKTPKYYIYSSTRVHQFSTYRLTVLGAVFLHLFTVNLHLLADLFPSTCSSLFYMKNVSDFVCSTFKLNSELKRLIDHCIASVLDKTFSNEMSNLLLVNFYRPTLLLNL